ncbi:unnamed protein product [Ceratitis capitata]|uniref:(Mediterranean fruit fly) hypothetical protein n=1 Tax=Ceratitis capitata TaxID=7213 RepID=A0A811VE95_CERCA|nr:unnamed protein product [Ceratitis capitata]
MPFSSIRSRLSSYRRQNDDAEVAIVGQQRRRRTEYEGIRGREKSESIAKAASWAPLYINVYTFDLPVVKETIIGTFFDDTVILAVMLCPI